MYGGYRPIVAPQPVYVGSSAAPVVAGLIGFGAGVILAESVDRRPWGWNSWGMRWGEPGYRWHRNEPPPPPSRRPAVIYNNNTYVSRSTTVVQNIPNTRINNVDAGVVDVLHHRGRARDVGGAEHPQHAHQQRWQRHQHREQPALRAAPP